ncbi:putative non-specific serine/threonine protein kinase [Helianthus anomalus]
MLQTLYLINCSIKGTIPEDIRKLESLQRLELSNNFLDGEIPTGSGVQTIYPNIRISKIFGYHISLSGSVSEISDRIVNRISKNPTFYLIFNFYDYFFIFITGYFFMIISSSSQSNQFQIILKFKTNLSNSNIKNFTSWTEHNTVCNFTGIVCDCANNVKEINLSEQQLMETVAFGLTCSLELLQKFSLGSNLLHGTISSNLSYCTSL